MHGVTDDFTFVCGIVLASLAPDLDVFSSLSPHGSVSTLRTKERVVTIPSLCLSALEDIEVFLELCAVRGLIEGGRKMARSLPGRHF